MVPIPTYTVTYTQMRLIFAEDILLTELSFEYFDS